MHRSSESESDLVAVEGYAFEIILVLDAVTDLPGIHEIGTRPNGTSVAPEAAAALG